MKLRVKILALLLALSPGLSFAAELDGRGLSLFWAVPFAGLLLSIALGPLLFPFKWHPHYGKITLGWVAAFLLTTMASTLAAISCGAVFMGANSYIGNAPNLMVKAIAEERGVRMPSFFGYMGWSSVVLLPLFVVMTLLFF